jgi:hypothetical protein
VGYLSLGVIIQPNTQTDPNFIADAWFEMYSNKNKAKETFPTDVTPQPLWGINFLNAGLLSRYTSVPLIDPLPV